MSILETPEYKKSLDALEEAIRAHHAFLEKYGNENDANEDGTVDTSVVSGWVLIIGTTGVNSEIGEFHDAMVEIPPSQNNFMSVGLAQYGSGFTSAQITNYLSTEDD